MTELGSRGGAKRGVGETRALVLSLLQQGKGIREVARILDISTQAVDYHRSRLIADGEYEEATA